MKIYNKTKNTLIAHKVAWANTFFSRMRGLLHRSSLGQDEALIITHCQSIHMFFMKFPIDAIFVDKTYQVVGVVEALKPFCLSKIFFKASCVIEVSVGTVEKTKTQVGDSLGLGQSP